MMIMNYLMETAYVNQVTFKIITIWNVDVLNYNK